MILVILDYEVASHSCPVIQLKDKGNLRPAYSEKDFDEGSVDGETERGLYPHAPSLGVRIMLKLSPESERGLYPY